MLYNIRLCKRNLLTLSQKEELLNIRSTEERMKLIIQYYKTNYVEDYITDRTELRSKREDNKIAEAIMKFQT